MLFETMPAIGQKEVEEGLRFASEQILRNLGEFTEQFQDCASQGLFYKPVKNEDWTNGFWTGEIWLAWEYCRDQRLKDAALKQVDSFYDRIVNKICVDHHDMGFLYSPSCVAAYKLTGNKKAREAAILAADQLISRYHEVGEFIQAWGPMNQPENYRLIIDCLLNLPLLYWASEETGDPKYKDIAEKHIHTAMKTVIREDYSTWHTFFFDMETGEPDHGATCQGKRAGVGHLRLRAGL